MTYLEKEFNLFCDQNGVNRTIVDRLPNGMVIYKSADTALIAKAFEAGVRIAAIVCKA